jgi:hypothetical protein
MSTTNLVPAPVSFSNSKPAPAPVDGITDTKSKIVDAVVTSVCSAADVAYNASLHTVVDTVCEGAAAFWAALCALGTEKK